MKLANLLVRGLIRAYQALVSPVLPGACRYYPTCSQYALEAVSARGVLLGGWLALKRIGRCHPWADGGWDPVPEAEPADSSRDANRCQAHTQETV
jgi:uncharacterized protein